MTFIWPAMLLALLLLPLLALLYSRQQARRRRLAAAYGLFSAAPARSRRRHLPAGLFLAALALLLLALARPESVVSLPRIEGTVMLAFDISGSMAATDLEPTRLEAAKNAARAFVGEQREEILIGVVAFSDGGFTVQAPTDDRDAVLATINRLGPARGTSLGSGILAALKTLEGPEEEAPAESLTDLTPEPTATPTPVPAGVFAPAAIVLLSDGENTTDPDPLEAARGAADRGVRIHTVGIGSAEGITLEVEGFLVHTRLDEAMLRGIAELTGGTYYYAADEAELQTIYESLDTQLVIKSEKMEVTAIAAGLGMFLLLLGGLLSLLWFGRVP
jgi:Ca-activated chloride channel family protein